MLLTLNVTFSFEGFHFQFYFMFYQMLPLWEKFYWHTFFSLHQVDMHWFEVGKSSSKKNGLICFNESPLKSHSHSPKKIIICFNKSPLKMMKNAFYFIIKARFFLQIFKVLSWLFRHVEKTAWLEGQGLFQNLWRHNLVNKQWQYTYWPISHQVQALYEAKESSLQLSFNHFR